MEVLLILDNLDGKKSFGVDKTSPAFGLCWRISEFLSYNVYN